jgi:hypothetical protein
MAAGWPPTAAANQQRPADAGHGRLPAMEAVGLR